MNGDGFLDIAVAFEGTDQVKWFRNIGGDGSFSAGIDIDAFAEAISVELADVDGDGDLDAVCASKSDGKKCAPTAVYTCLLHACMDGVNSFDHTPTVSPESLELCLTVVPSRFFK